MFSEAHPEFHLIYITSERHNETFYYRTKFGWTRTGNDEYLYTVFDDLYEHLQRIYSQFRPNTNILVDNFYKEQYSKIKITMALQFRLIAFQLNHIIKPTFEATKDIILFDNDSEEVEALPDIVDVEDPFNPKPTYIVRTESQRQEYFRHKKNGISYNDNLGGNYDPNYKPSDNIIHQDHEDIINDEHSDYDEQHNDADENYDEIEEDISNKELFLTKDKRQLYIEHHGKKQYFVSVERKSMYEIMSPKKLSQLDIDDLKTIGYKHSKGRYDFYNE
jgi:hypothetical protein